MLVPDAHSISRHLTNKRSARTVHHANGHVPLTPEPYRLEIRFKRPSNALRSLTDGAVDRCRKRLRADEYAKYAKQDWTTAGQ
jgi:hypothetical protein